MFHEEEKSKKGKSVAFLAEEQDYGIELEDIEDETLVLMTKDFSKILKQIN